MLGELRKFLEPAEPLPTVGWLSTESSLGARNSRALSSSSKEPKIDQESFYGSPPPPFPPQPFFLHNEIAGFKTSSLLPPRGRVSPETRCPHAPPLGTSSSFEIQSFLAKQERTYPEGRVFYFGGARHPLRRVEQP